MAKREFDGNLDDISPKLLMDESELDKFQSLFLILGLAFNDLKGLLLLRRLIEECYRRPESGEVSVQMGEWAGMINQNNKLLISTVGEFLLFLEENKDVTCDLRFQLLLKQLPTNIQRDWDKLCNPGKKSSSFLSKIARIRSNVAFHYDHSMEELRRGFIRSFYAERKGLVQHERAYFSLGPTMKYTRFYYADAAVEDYIESIMSKQDMLEIGNNINGMNETLRAIMEVYIKSIRK